MACLHNLSIEDKPFTTDYHGPAGRPITRALTLDPVIRGFVNPPAQSMLSALVRRHTHSSLVTPSGPLRTGTAAALCALLTIMALASWTEPAEAASEGKALDSELIVPPNSIASPGRLDYPRRKPGLWEIRSSASEQLGLPPVRLCVGDQTDTPEHHLDRKVGKRGACQLGAFKRVGINWVADSTCKDSRTTIVSQSTVTGDFQSHYRIDTVILYSPPLANNRREDSEYTEARWLGPCPDNQKPADLTIPGMGVLNMLDGGLRPESAGQR